MTTAVSSTRLGTAYAAMAQLRADRAQLLADLAAQASPQIIAADKTNVSLSNHRVTVHAGRLDTIV
jgi:hypothetical protein